MCLVLFISENGLKQNVKGGDDTAGGSNVGHAPALKSHFYVN